MNATWNDSLPPAPPLLFGPGHRVKFYGNMILMSVSGIENLTVLILLCLHRPISRVSKLLISLTVSDLLVTFLTMPLEIGWAYTVLWLADNATCKIMMFGRIFGLYSSSFNLVAISIDRYCVIMYPFINLTASKKRITWLLTSVWLLSALCSLPQAVVFSKQFHPDYPTLAQCVTFNSFRTPELEMAYNIFVTLMLFILPLILFSIFYGRMWCFIRQRNIMSARAALGESDPLQFQSQDTCRRHSSMTFTSRPSRFHIATKSHTHFERGHMSITEKSLTNQSIRCNNASNIYLRAQSKSSKMAVTLVLVFLICWVPYNVVSCWFWFDKESLSSVDQRIQSLLFIFAVSQSCFNPIVTGVFCLRLDRKLAELGSCCWGKTLGIFRRAKHDEDDAVR